MSIKQQRNKFVFFISYHDSMELLEDEHQQLMFLKYIFDTQFGDRDVNDLPSDTPMLKLACSGIKHNLSASIAGYKHATRGVGAQKVDSAMQSGMSDGTQGEKLIDAFTLKYLGSNIELFDVLYKEFKDNGKDPDCENNYELYLGAFRDKMHNRGTGWKKSVQGINALFRTHIRNKWIDIERMDLS